RGYFITNQQSPYFETQAFRNILTFVQANPRRTSLKEVKNTLRLGIDNVTGIDEAVELLNGMLEE
ncbi:MAG: hypothetical protein V4619_09030, partial [Bacteroidota bacterium]